MLQVRQEGLYIDQIHGGSGQAETNKVRIIKHKEGNGERKSQRETSMD